MDGTAFEQVICGYQMGRQLPTALQLRCSTKKVSLACSYVVLVIQRAWGTAGM